MHALVFWGFIFFSIITIDHFLLAYNIHFFSNDFKNLYANFFGIPWSIFVIIGILSLSYRRFISRPKYLGEKISYTSGDFLPLYFLKNNFFPIGSVKEIYL